MYQVKPPPKGTINCGLPKFANEKCGKERVFKRTKLDSDWGKYKDESSSARRTCNTAYNQYIQATFTDERKQIPRSYLHSLCQRVLILQVLHL